MRLIIWLIILFVFCLGYKIGQDIYGLTCYGNFENIRYVKIIEDVDCEATYVYYELGEKIGWVDK